jgi:hypothetical protein
MRTARKLAPLAILALGAGVISALPPTAAAASLPVINVHESDHGFTVSGASLNRHAGRVTFHYTTSTTNPNNGSEVDLLQIRHGYTFAEAEHAAAMEGANDPATAAAGTRGLQTAVHFFGGANLNLPSQSENITETLYAGTYYLVDTGSQGVPQITPIHVSGTPSPEPWPTTGATILVGNGASDRFKVSGTIKAGSSILIRNNGDGQTIHFTQFIPIVPGTTDATIQALFTSNSNSQPPQILGPGLSAGILSPGTQEIVSSPNLTPGTYVLVCFVADDVTGMPHALMGMHLVVTIT